MDSNKETVYVIINPISGTKSKKDIPEMLTTLDPYRFEVHIFITCYEGHATQIAKEAVDLKVKYVIAVGGDGTINEIAKGLINTDTVLGIIPSGSGNGLARDLHISMDYSKAIETIKENNIKEIDYGVANDHIFFCTCGVGFDASVSEKVISHKNRGIFMYAKSMLEVFMTYDPEKYIIESPNGYFEDKAFVVTCANASQYGNNSYIAPDADISDGKMNIAILKPFPVYDAAKTAIQLMSKNIGNNAKLVEIVTSQAVIKRTEAGVMHLDGDAIQTDKDIHVKIVHKGLKVLVPSEIPQTTSDIVQNFFTNITRWL